MSHELLAAVTCGSCYLIGALAAYPRMRRRWPWADVVLRLAAVISIGLGLGYLLHATARDGFVAAFERNFEAILLLSMLIGTAGLGASLSLTLRGLDGLLFFAAGAVQLAGALVLGAPEAPTGRPWFVSHGLTFAVSAAFFTAGGAAGIAYLLVNWMLRHKRLGLLRGVPPLESLERFGRWMPIIGFPLFTFGILTGLCGVAHRKFFGVYAWYLDPTFLFSVAAWVVYAYLIFGLMYRPRVRGRRAAALAASGLALVLAAFVAREFVSRLHQ